MSSPATNTPVGTCKANVIGDSDFSSFTASAVDAWLDKKTDLWRINAKGIDANGISQFFSLTLNNHGDVTDRQYPFAESLGSNNATAFYVKNVFGTHYNYQAIKGTIRVTIDTSKKTLSAIFDFDSIRGPISLRQGELEVQGLDTADATHEISEKIITVNTSMVEANLTGSMTRHYKSSAVEMSLLPPSRTSPGSILAWSQYYLAGRPSQDIRISLNPPQSIKPGTYTLDEVSSFKIFLFELSPAQRNYHSVSGEVELTSAPTPGTTDGTLAGTFRGLLQGMNISDIVEVKNGKFNFSG